MHRASSYSNRWEWISGFAVCARLVRAEIGEGGYNRQRLEIRETWRNLTSSEHLSKQRAWTGPSLCALATTGDTPWPTGHSGTTYLRKPAGPTSDSAASTKASADKTFAARRARSSGSDLR